MSKSQLLHPLCGADLATLTAVLRRYGPPSPRRTPQLALILGASIGRLPFNAIERRRAARTLPSLEEIPAPLFILGHWRSGTTHLYNLLSQSQEFGYVSPLATGMPWNLLGLVPRLRPMLERGLPQHRFIDNVAITPESPQEDEAAIANMCPTSFYHALYFPKYFRRAFMEGVFFDNVDDNDIQKWKNAFTLFIKKVTKDQNQKRLIVKNPSYTARVSMIREIWPDAQFIHIRRNPFVVFQSMRNFHYKLCAALGLQTQNPVDVDSVVLETYSRMMDMLSKDTTDLPPNQFMDVRFEDLEAKPIETIEGIYNQLRIKNFDQTKIMFHNYLSTIKSYKKNSYSFSESDIITVSKAWGEYVTPWGYSAPS